jgi:hypothetical protein
LPEVTCRGDSRAGGGDDRYIPGFTGAALRALGGILACQAHIEPA